eukprot:1268040-Rhodomonas_salina.1
MSTRVPGTRVSWVCDMGQIGTDQPKKTTIRATRHPSLQPSQTKSNVFGGPVCMSEFLINFETA